VTEVVPTPTLISAADPNMSRRKPQIALAVGAGLVLSATIALGSLIAMAEPAGAKSRKLTVAQVASVVASLRSDLLKEIDDVNTNCSPIDGCTMLGNIQVIALDLQAETLVIKLRNLTHPSKKTTLAIPKSLAPLVKDTGAALTDVSAEAKAVNACAKADPSSPCRPEAIQLNFSTTSLRQTLEAWAPYL
jgi:hypothetical protein